MAAVNLENDELYNSEEDHDEEELITYYFYRGFKYIEILRFLEGYHGISMSISTLKRRIKGCGLFRRQPEYEIATVSDMIKSVIDGPGGLMGYRSVWHSLQMRGLRVPRVVVQELLREIDPEGTELRKAHKLKRRVYVNLGPNYAWHCDGYDKLKPYGFPVHGCIDGFSRKILWLYVTRSNNQPNNVATYYLDAVEKYGGCPIDLITDLGTENGTMAALQCFFRNEESSHRYVPSPRNQRIESWWGFFKKINVSWWINFFKDIVDMGILDLTSQLHTECMWFCFSHLIQCELDQVQDHWNTHYIRKSKQGTHGGRPDSLYYLPHLHGATSDLLLPVPPTEMEYARSELVDVQEDNDYQEYFTYVMENFNFNLPSNWREALELFEVLVNCANGLVHD